MSCRLRRTSIRTRSFDNNALIQPESRQPLRVCWLKAGLTPCGSYIRTGRSGHSGITNLNAGRRTKACDSITFCSHRICRSGLVEGGVDRWGARPGKRERSRPNVDSCLIFRPEFFQAQGQSAPSVQRPLAKACQSRGFHSIIRELCGSFPYWTVRYKCPIARNLMIALVAGGGFEPQVRIDST